MKIKNFLSFRQIEMRPSLFIIVPALAFSNSEHLDQEPEPEMKLSDEDEALIKHTLRTLTFITLDTNSDDDETRLLFKGRVPSK